MGLQTSLAGAADGGDRDRRVDGGDPPSAVGDGGVTVVHPPHLEPRPPSQDPASAAKSPSALAKVVKVVEAIEAVEVEADLSPLQASNSLSESASICEKKTDPAPGCSSMRGEKSALSEAPYHVFTYSKKRMIVLMVSLAGLFSPLSSNIYLPALEAVSSDLNVSASTVALSITVFMAVQGVAPSFWGPLSDTWGRRVAFMGTLLVYQVANLGLALGDNVTGLMVFRGIQAAGSAATIAIGSGVIGDITTAKERGGLMGIFGGLRQTGQALGPVLGGLISEFLGYRAIFWFLFILAALVIVLILVLLPETLRTVAGDGTVPLHGYHKPLIYAATGQPQVIADARAAGIAKFRVGAIIAPFRSVLEKDVFVTMFFGAIVYTVHAMVTTTTSHVFHTQFALTNLQVGLVFLPNGAGVVLGALWMGWQMDRNYAHYERRYRREHDNFTGPLDKTRPDFPIERARLRWLWLVVAVFVTTVSAYGYSLRLNRLAVPLVLHLIIAFTATAMFTSNSALVVDLFPSKAASATAVVNLTRCLLGALGVAVVQPLINRLGLGPTYLACGLCTLAASPLLVLQWRHGREWRNERVARQRKKQDVEEGKGAVAPS